MTLSLESLVAAIVVVFAAWWVGFLVWTAWSERRTRNVTSNEARRTSVGKDW